MIFRVLLQDRYISNISLSNQQGLFKKITKKLPTNNFSTLIDLIGTVYKLRP